MEDQNITYHIPSDISGNDLDDVLNQFSAPMRDHSRRVAVCSAIMAEYAKLFPQLFDIPVKINLEVIAYLGGVCHDIGKLSNLSPAAKEKDDPMHPVIGAALLEKHKETLFDNETQAQMVLETVRHHHEQPDGGGFPDGLRAGDIPMTAGICAIADRLDHCFFPEHKPYSGTTDIFNDIELQARKRFSESAVICFKHAWPRLTEWYAGWNLTAG